MTTTPVRHHQDPCRNGRTGRTGCRRARCRTSPAAPGTTPQTPAGTLAARWRQLAARPDTGAATAELVIAMPLLLGIILTIIQAGIWLHATHIAQAAATQAAVVAAAHNSTATAGQHAGQATLAELGHNILTGTTVTVIRTPTEVRVEVAGTAATVVPGITWTVHAIVVRPVEAWMPDPAAQGDPS